MKWSLDQNVLYWGKIGADNLLLMLVGILHLIIWYMKRKDGYARIREELLEGVFFLVYGFAHDIYRYMPLRTYLLRNSSFLSYNIVILCALLVPLYIQLIVDLRRLIMARMVKKHVDRAEHR